MSIDINWRTATSGPDGEALAERIRSFIHDRFQQVALPRFIRSVQVHSFDFGTIPPELEIKDFCEPFADFYEEDDDADTSDVSEDLLSEHSSQWDRTHSELNEPPYREESAMNHGLRDPFHEGFPPSPLRSPLGEHLNPHFLPRAGTPGIPGGTSNLGYHLMSLGGLSGTQTPLAAVAGGNPFASGWSDSGMGFGNRGRSERQGPIPQHRPEPEIDTSNSTSRPSTANTLPSHLSESNNLNADGATGRNERGSLHNGDPLADHTCSGHLPLPPRMRERRPEDFQVLCHAKYAGDVRLSLTAEILLDYPMPSFVGLPLKLNVTGITFDGVAVVAYIRKRVHFCFLSAEDADALIGSEQQQESGGDDHRPRSGADSSAHTSQKRQGGLLQEIRVESEIGRKENGKQVLKNVGKVERFVLAQVRRIFEEELVYPSFWTFLI
ncbi:ERMES complex subunit MDM12 [Aspergillus clavatus NRRL 1]|uniref:Mitochondrial distribution and morphology protein 12 n=1 Tax=Aspergillus clavatus (strain ATCC 1007 / CBS 513.65 / DSM 816 / NCTC 3887 / NRRL 1 / QM 1276 / 107) TaxID=344612 RepID=MDM12_ASPCL|nr:mitochondrial inheritance component mdm12 [Aspergillus clavatus NRRL 1]A1CNY1.1 RecName: Full=Mitochondrial distribution and morphology protein 12; AltName: Full=Mitochondrial inheritance component MDM12 [Aspergillus clavatus NRRL 1]EAW07352.1 mitochondrial inheritance component mdm12 [Aspergillus clavatus NRRL 1]